MPVIQWQFTNKKTYMQNKYESRDFYLSAYLITSGQKLLSAGRTKSITLFNFEDTAELRRLVDQYYSMQAKADPLAYGSSIRALKSIIHSSNLNSQEQITNEAFRK
jgi:hypothetical protein